MEKGEQFTQPDLRAEDELLHGAAKFAKGGVDIMPRRVDGAFDPVEGGQFSDEQLIKPRLSGGALYAKLGIMVRDELGRLERTAYPDYAEKTDAEFDVAHERLNLSRQQRFGSASRKAVLLKLAREASAQDVAETEAISEESDYPEAAA